MQAELTQKIYHVHEEKYGKRSAKITFNLNGGIFKFFNCEFNVEGKKFYNLEDWMFLQDLATEILILSGTEIKNFHNKELKNE